MLYSLEVPLGYLMSTHNIFSWKNKKNIYLTHSLIWSYDFALPILWFLFYFDTLVLVLLVHGSNKRSIQEISSALKYIFGVFTGIASASALNGYP